MNVAEQEIQPYHEDVAHVGLVEDIEAFWKHLSEERTKKGIAPITE